MKEMIKKIIKLFIPPVFIKLCKIIISIFSKKEKTYSTIKNIHKKSDKLIILGNGPSFSKSIIKYKEQTKNNDCIAVNNFCNTDYFSEIKPNIYVIADPSNLGKIDNLSDSLREETEKIVEKLSAINWDMNLIVPDFAKEGFLVNAIKNPLIKVYFYNTKDKPKYKQLYDNWNANCVTPPAQTVLNTCVYLGIFLNYKEIYILGMDMSWHEDLELDQKTNELFIVDKHFYGTKKRFATLDINGKKPAKVHEYLRCSVNALESFWDLRGFADYKNVNVYNCSDHSWVDAFERINEE